MGHPLARFTPLHSVHDTTPPRHRPIPPPFGEPTEVERVSVVDLQKIADERGDLVVAELGEHVPFLTRRLYALVNVPRGAERGGHAHRALQQVITVLSGAVELVVDDGKHRQRIYLDEQTRAIYLRPMVWRELTKFEAGTVVAVLASEVYDEADYIRDYAVFLDELRARGLCGEPRAEAVRCLSSMRPLASSRAG